MENIRIIVTFIFYVRHTTNIPCISATFTSLSLFVTWVVFSLYPSDEFADYHNVSFFFAWEIFIPMKVTQFLCLCRRRRDNTVYVRSYPCKVPPFFVRF